MAFAGQLGQYFLGFVDCAPAMQHDPVAGRREHLRDLRPDAARRTRDKHSSGHCDPLSSAALILPLIRR